MNGIFARSYGVNARARYYCYIVAQFKTIITLRVTINIYIGRPRLYVTSHSCNYLMTNFSVVRCRYFKETLFARVTVSQVECCTLNVLMIYIYIYREVICAARRADKTRREEGKEY